MVHRNRGFCVLLVLAAALAVGCGDDGGGVLTGEVERPTSTLQSPAGSSTTLPVISSTTATSPPTTRVPSKVGEPPSTVPSGRVPVDGPRPATTPNISQPLDSLHDGEHVAFMVDVDVARREVDIDVVQWFLRPDFETAIAEGRLSSSDPCLELDYCIANAQDRVRVMSVAPNARVSVVDYASCCESLRTDALSDVFDRMREGRDLFVLEVVGGQVTALDELYLP